MKADKEPLKAEKADAMILMVVLLLIMNCVLATGLGILWFRSRSWCENSIELEDRLKGRMHGLESRLADLEATRGEDSPVSPDWNAAEINKRLENREVTKGIPERYRLAVSMAESGMDLHQISKSIGISNHEAEQLMNLALLSRPEPYED